jgi:ABC-type sugar transport system permease subunit
VPALLLVAAAVVPALVAVAAGFIRTAREAGGVRGVWTALAAEPRLWASLGDSLGFLGLVLVLAVPLGLALALCLPAHGLLRGGALLLLGVIVLAPQGVVDVAWGALADPDAGLLVPLLARAGFDFAPARDPWHARATLLAMEAWRAAAVFALVCHGALHAISPASARAAEVDGLARRRAPWRLRAHALVPAVGVAASLAALPLIARRWGPLRGSLPDGAVRAAAPSDLTLAAAQAAAVFGVLALAVCFCRSAAGARRLA